MMKQSMQATKSLLMEDSKMQDIIKVWKSKSLNPRFMERYKIPLVSKREQSRQISKKKSSKIQESKSQSEFKTDILPEPKFVKINQQIFCLYLNDCLLIFKLLNEAEKQLNKPKPDEKQKTFSSVLYQFQESIKFVVGNYSEYIFVGFANQLHILELEYQQEKNEENVISKNFKGVKLAEKKMVNKLKAVSFIKQLKQQIEVPLMVVITNDKVVKYKIPNKNQPIDKQAVEQLKIVFEKQQDNLTFSQINSIQVLCQNNIFLYLFATRQGFQLIMDQYSNKSSGKQRKCEFLYLIKFNLDTKSNDTIKPLLSMIDHVFETGIFSKSKIFQSGPSVFLISLFEEIIVVKYHFEKYVVWDNISLASSKSNEKKGQLVLADKIVMVYIEGGEIYAHNIFFSSRESKLKYPRIDNFKAGVNEDDLLYDAIVLQYEEGSFMKVLFYFKETQVYTPNNRVAVHKQQRIQGDHKQLSLYIQCIKQNSPLLKLQQLYKGKKTPQQISQFVQRFSIAELDRSKCEWSVSQKGQKDIQTLLLQIKDNKYIQNELTTILKSSPHDLKFLIRIQKKQIERYKKMLATKLLKNDQQFNPQMQRNLYELTGRYFNKQEIEEIKQIIKWVMESIMFEKKLLYSKNFLEFMEYDFIQIGKLKAASLKEEIKLLSCKGYQKRLMYFLNSFKYMILANFKDIFEFLIENKSEEEVQKFFTQNFPFILPNFVQTSQVFKQKNRTTQQRQRKYSFMALPQLKQRKQDQKEDEQKQTKEEQKCQLWQNKFNNEEERKKIQTKQSFKYEIQTEIKAAHANANVSANKSDIKTQKIIMKQCLSIEAANQEFEKILDEFVKDDWFQSNKSKQHSIIQSDVKNLEFIMEDYKRIGVFNLLVNFFYRKVASKLYKLDKVDHIFHSFKKEGLIPESFEQNILARRTIYNRIKKIKRSDVSLRTLQDFLIMQETDYFDYIFYNYREMILKEVRPVYDGILIGLFREKFQIYLNSDKIQLREIIKFLENFQGNNHVDIRFDIFTCIKNLLKVSDKPNTSIFVEKLMELEILKRQGNSHSGIDTLIDQAKIAFGYYFYNFFSIFEIDSTYKELIAETQEPDYQKCPILKQMIQKFCSDNYKKPEFEEEDDEQKPTIKLEPCYGLDEVIFPIEKQPLQFFGIILYILDTMRFEVSSQKIFDKFLELELTNENHDEIVQFVSDYEQIFLMNDREDDENQNLPIYLRLLKSFYEESDFTFQDRVIQNLLIWIRKQYHDLMKKGYQSEYYCNMSSQRMLQNVRRVFDNVITPLTLQNAQIRRQKSILQLLQKVKNISLNLFTYILTKRFQNFNDNYLQQNSPLFNETSTFIFMIRLFKQIPKQKFDAKEEQAIFTQIRDIQEIQSLFGQASLFKNQDKIEDDILLDRDRFWNQLVMRLIEDRQFKYCYIILTTRFINKDAFYQFFANIQTNYGKPTQEEFKKFFQNFIQITNKVTRELAFKSYIVQNNISEFFRQKQIENGKHEDRMVQSSLQRQISNKEAQQRKRRPSQMFSRNDKNAFPSLEDSKKNQQVKLKPQQLAKTIFLTLLENNKIQEAFYFLVRNKHLGILQASRIAIRYENTESYSLVTIYLKCLKQFLCPQFFPTFTFYQQKHQILLNPYQRKDLIKDINIALSRIKQMISQQKFNSMQRQVRRQKQAKQPKLHKIIEEVIQTSIQLTKRQYKNDDVKNKQEEKRLEDIRRQEEWRKFEKMCEDLKVYLKQLEVNLGELEELYVNYMRSIGQDPHIKLNEQDLKKGKQKLHNMNLFRTPDQLGLNTHQAPHSPRFETDSNKQQNFLKKNHITKQELSLKQQQQQEQKLQRMKKKSKQNPQYIEIERQLNNKIKETKQLAEKYEHSDVVMPKSGEREKNYKNYEKLKLKEEEQINSIKSSYKSKTADRVNQILEEIKMRKSKIQDKSDAKSKYSKISIADSEDEQRRRKISFEAPQYDNKLPSLLSPPDLKPNHQKQKNRNDSLTSNQYSRLQSQKRQSELSDRKYEVKVVSAEGHIKNLFMPVTMSKNVEESHSRISSNSRQPLTIADLSKINHKSEIGSHGTINIDNLQTHGFTLSRIEDRGGSRVQKSHMNKMTAEDMIKIFADKQPQCLKYVEKIEIVKNNVQVGLQIIKNIYSTITNFEVFIKFIGFELESSPKYKEVIQQKAYKIAQQAMGIEYKINLKELFPIDLFTTVVNSNIKQYYRTAYEIIRPNLMKILAKQDTNVHGMAILFRFGFGSENTYYYRVYEDYVTILLKQYSCKPVDQKSLFLLAQKLRTLYGNINTENRQAKFQKLLKQVANDQKRKALGKEMLKILQRRNEMLTGEKQNDLRQVLQRIS